MSTETWDVKCAARVLAQDTEIATLHRELRSMHKSLSRIHDLASTMDGGTREQILQECRGALRIT